MPDAKEKISFEYCALRFLQQWTARERELWWRIKGNPSGETIREALNYFVVARTFPGLAKNPGRISSVIRSQFLATRDTRYSPVEMVDSLAQKFLRRFKRNNVSAASKLLWLSGRSKFVIYDRRALTSLNVHFDARIADRDYREYEKAWRGQFLGYDTAIRTAVEQLPNARPFIRNCTQSHNQLKNYANQRWFRERVFDIYLWELAAFEA